MFQFFFKYPMPVFSKGKFVLLGAWPGWLLLLLTLACAAGLAVIIWSRLPAAAAHISKWRAGTIWLLQSLLIATVLVLLWQPAITVAELAPQQNVIAVVLDDSRSMAIADSGSDGKTPREAAAQKALEGGVLAGLQKRFQTRLYRLDTRAGQVAALKDIQPAAPATHLNEGLRQLTRDTSDLPIGAVVLLSDGSDNSGDLALETINTLRNRRLPVHTVGFGKERLAHDVEISDVNVATRALADSRIPATVTFHQRGYAGSKAVLLVRDGEKTVGSREITFGAQDASQVETVFFSPGAAGAKNLHIVLGPLPGEENLANNSVARLLGVTDDKRRILYVEGEPRWEYKFIRRAEDDDKIVQVASMLRTTENKIYRQGISDPKELESGFPVRPEDLFAYDGIILGSVEAGYFSPLQQELLREFVDRRGGGLLFLGGRFSLSDGGWRGSSLVDLLPTILPNSRNTFHRNPATAELTVTGSDSPITRLMDDPAKNLDRWKKLTYLMDYQDAGTPKPGATVLAQLSSGGRKLPLLVTQNYGRGRTAIMATSGTWRWQMSQPLGDPAHDLFWQQLLRWLVLDSPGQIALTAPAQTLMDDGQIQITANVRDKSYMPVTDAKVTAHLTGPDGLSTFVDMTPAADVPGEFHANWTAEKPGSYLAEVTASGETGNGTLPFERIDGVAENFHIEQNRELLEKLASETGGRYWKPDELTRLPNEISYSDAGISVRDIKELWNMPAVFVWLLFLISTEWLLRRKWGVV
ncbi:MAG TPA: glutamine amidotransferase [Acidobacteriaceae bacterium]|nr:glutamine amidotransferase [Acidobacteriaceae bacterium]